jgi:hypothetical protein
LPRSTLNSKTTPPARPRILYARPGLLMWHSQCSALEAISQPYKKRVLAGAHSSLLFPVIRCSWVTRARRPLGRALARPCASNPSSKFGWPLFVFERLSYRRIPARPRVPPPPYAAAEEEKRDASAGRPMARQASASIVSEDELEELRHYDTWSASGSAARIAISLKASCAQAARG